MAQKQNIIPINLKIILHCFYVYPMASARCCLHSAVVVVVDILTQEYPGGKVTKGAASPRDLVWAQNSLENNIYMGILGIYCFGWFI